MSDDSSDLDALLALARGADDAPPPSLAVVPPALVEATGRAGIRDRARALPTPVRVAVAVLVVALASGIPAAFLHPRADLDALTWTRVLATLTATAGVALFAAGAALRGTYVRPWPAWLTTGLGVLVLVPAVLAVVPGWWGGNPAPMATWSAHLPCLGYGLFGAVISGGVTLFLDRADDPAPWRVLAASGAGGLVAFTSLGVHCASGNVLHMLVAHAVQGLLVGGAFFALAAVRARRAG